MQYGCHQELGRKLIQVPVGVSKNGWLSFWDMVKDFLKKYEE